MPRFSSHSRSSSITTASTPPPLRPARSTTRSVSSLVSLDNAVEAVAARVTPAVVNVAVTSRVSPGEQGDGEGEGHHRGPGGQGFGGIDPQDLPPGFRQFFFGPNGQGEGRGQNGA